MQPGLVLRCPGVTAVPGGLSPGTGMGPSPSHTQHWTLLPPQPTARELPGLNPRGNVAGSSPGWTGCGVELPFLPGVSCSINEPLCATQHSCPCFGGRRGHGQDVRMPGGGSPGALAEAGAAGGEHRDRPGPVRGSAQPAGWNCAALPGMRRSHRRSPAHREWPRPLCPGTGRASPSHCSRGVRCPQLLPLPQAAALTGRGGRWVGRSVLPDHSTATSEPGGHRHRPRSVGPR